LGIKARDHREKTMPRTSVSVVSRSTLLLASLALLGLSACAPSEPPAESSAATSGAAAPSAAELADGLLAAMGGRAALEAVDTLVLRGEGTRTRMGQIAVTGGEDPMGSLAAVTETIDLSVGRAAFDYDVVIGEFMMHRTEVLTSFEGEPVGWNTGPDRPNIAVSPNGLFSWAAQNTPEMLLRRNVISVALAAANTASAEQAAAERAFNGAMSLFGTAALPSGENVELYFNPATGLLDGFATLDTETMLGDVDAEYVLSDYRRVNGLVLPHSVTIRKQGRPYSSMVYSSITINDPAALAIFTIPESAVEQAREVVAADGSWAPLTWTEVAPGIYHAVGYSHHSMVVEFPTFVAVVEGPYTEAQSLTLARRIEEEIGKPIAYVAPTHPHYDHTGGIRGLAAVGATVMVAGGHEAELRAIVESPHTNPPDELARALAAGSEVGAVEVFSDMTVIEEGDRRLELHEVATIPHVNPKVLAYVPDAGVLFQSDIFFGAPSPDATALHTAIRNRGLDVRQIVGGHGGVLPFSALETAASAQ
jgi:glyoxylase-like metal-dependent hydrolase (beta-lactamase superfamily II)